jgi:hypothetical protein
VHAHIQTAWREGVRPLWFRTMRAAGSFPRSASVSISAIRGQSGTTRSCPDFGATESFSDSARRTGLAELLVMPVKNPNIAERVTGDKR